MRTVEMLADVPRMPDVPDRDLIIGAWSSPRSLFTTKDGQAAMVYRDRKSTQP